tara:strand:+ start:28943 stop:29515 length:573 start_codon:yes stop_codon:yes gene_type:complete
MKRRIAITGSTRGIGKAIADQLENEGHSIIGLSRSNFNLQEDWGDIEDKLDSIHKKCDIFINNAHHRYSQVRILQYLFERWQRLPKTIINISSSSGDKKQERGGQWASYQIEKIALDQACKQLDGLGKCKVVNIRPGWVDTDATKDLKKPIGITILKPLKVAQIVSWIINQPYEVHIKDITIEPWYKKSK